jgi:hypothetical protein
MSLPQAIEDLVGEGDEVKAVPQRNGAAGGEIGQDRRDGGVDHEQRLDCVTHGRLGYHESMAPWFLLAAALPTLTLGKDLKPKTVMAPRDAKLCKPAPALITRGDDRASLTVDTVSYRVTVENPTAAPIKICLMHFSVVTGPLVMFSLSAASGLEEARRLPEVYPIPNEKVAFETLTLPAHTRLAVEGSQPIPRKSYAAAKDLKLSWSIILNHQYQNGSITVTP